MMEDPDNRTERLARARAFLAAGQTQIDPRPQQPPAEPAAAKPASDPQSDPVADPTRFGDWEKKGRCIDF